MEKSFLYVKRIMTKVFVVVLILTTTFLSGCGGGTEIIELSEAPATKISDANIYYIADGSLFASPKDGSYQLRIESDVLSPGFFAGNYVYFLSKSFGKGILARYSTESQEIEAFDGYIFEEEPTFWYNTHDIFGYTTVRGYVDESAEVYMTGPDYNIKCDGMGVDVSDGTFNNWFSDKTHDVTDYTRLLESKVIIETGGWEITLLGDTLTFSNGERTNKISGKNI